jgi:N,N'-diacetyllegionaminate synthase
MEDGLHGKKSMTRTFIIAEAGVNHNGDSRLALELVDMAARCGADAVKFQTFSAEKLVTLSAEKAEYQKRETGNGNQHAMLKALEISEPLHRELVVRCAEVGIEFMSTPFDEEAADFLLSLGMKRIKIPSGEITNEPFLAFLATKDVPLILSTGMATMDEIRRAVSIIETTRIISGFVEPLADILTILHCTSNYPAAYGDVNLRAMQSIGRDTGMPVGYSDHTLGLAVSTAAVALGAVVIEKHFTLDRSLSGPDHKASLSPEELEALVRQIRDVEMALGSTVKQPTVSELPVRSLVRRSVTVARLVMAGAALTDADVVLLRPGTGIAPGELSAVIGKHAAHDLEAGTILQWSDLQ